MWSTFSHKNNVVRSPAWPKKLLIQHLTWSSNLLIVGSSIWGSGNRTCKTGGLKKRVSGVFFWPWVEFELGRALPGFHPPFSTRLFRSPRLLGHFLSSRPLQEGSSPPDVTCPRTYLDLCPLCSCNWCELGFRRMALGQSILHCEWLIVYHSSWKVFIFIYLLKLFFESFPFYLFTFLFGCVGS